MEFCITFIYFFASADTNFSYSLAAIDLWKSSVMSYTNKFICLILSALLAAQCVLAVPGTAPPGTVLLVTMVYSLRLTVFNSVQRQCLLPCPHKSTLEGRRTRLLLLLPPLSKNHNGDDENHIHPNENKHIACFNCPSHHDSFHVRFFLDSFLPDTYANKSQNCL